MVASRRLLHVTLRIPALTVEDQETHSYRITEFQTDKGLRPDTAHLPDWKLRPETTLFKVTKAVTGGRTGLQTRAPDSQSGVPSTTPA